MAQIPIAENLFSWPSEKPQLIGARCAACGTTFFPAQQTCARCASSDLAPSLLARRGRLWSWTIQGFRPKSPPFTGPKAFEPYGVGYVELPGEVKVEARLTEHDPGRLRIGMEMELVVVPFSTNDDGDDVVTYAFRPVP